MKHYHVSNMSFLSKVLEYIVLKHEPFQSAYRNCHITETALLRVANDLLQASDNGCVSFLSLLDLLAAFGTTERSILITRLRATLNCSGTVLEQFISYLSCRTQSVLVVHEPTSSVLIFGVPKGSVLEPLLFTLRTCRLQHRYLSVRSFISFLCR